MDGRVRTARKTIVEANPGDVLLVRKALEEKGIIFGLTCFEKGEHALAGPDYSPEVGIATGICPHRRLAIAPFCGVNSGSPNDPFSDRLRAAGRRDSPAGQPQRSNLLAGVYCGVRKGAGNLLK